MRVASSHVYTSTWGTLDIEESFPASEPTDVAQIAMEDLRIAQDGDRLCERLRKGMNPVKGRPFVKDEGLVLVRISPLDGADQIIVPEILPEKVLLLSKNTRLGGRSGNTKMHYALRRIFYWPTLIAGGWRFCYHFQACAKECVAFRKHASRVNLSLRLGRFS